MRTRQVRNADSAILPAVAPSQVPADSSLRRLYVGIVAVIEDHQLDITEDRLDCIIVWAARGQRDPMQLQPSHFASRPL